MEGAGLTPCSDQGVRVVLAVILRLRNLFPNLKCSLSFMEVTVALKYSGSFPFPLRCFFIAQSYVLVKKWSEALVLYDRVLKYADEVNSDSGAFKNSLKVSRWPLFPSPEKLCGETPPQASPAWSA